jgi:hypothetical protein
MEPTKIEIMTAEAFSAIYGLSDECCRAIAKLQATTRAEGIVQGREEMRKATHEILNLNSVGHLDEEGVGKIRILKALEEIHAIPPTTDATPQDTSQPHSDDWRKTVGMFRGDAAMQEIAEAGREARKREDEAGMLEEAETTLSQCMEGFRQAQEVAKTAQEFSRDFQRLAHFWQVQTKEKEELLAECRTVLELAMSRMKPVHIIEYERMQSLLKRLP